MTEHAKQILDLLVEKTSNKEISWQKTSGTNQYKMQFQNGAVITITYVVAATGSGIHYYIYNDKGSVVEKVIIPKTSTEFAQIRNLYDLIGRIERKEDETFTSILNELKSKSNKPSNE